MKNILKWTNDTPMPFTLNIYRGSSALDRTALGTPIATLTAGESTYADTVLRGQTYFYIVEVVKDGEKIPSNNLEVLSVPRKGPGPAQLIQGDYNYGYFGSFGTRDFFSTSEIIKQVGTLTLPTNQILQEGPTWHKWIRNGKVLYIPNGPIAHSVSWQLLYEAGLVYGVDGPGTYNVGKDVNQLRVISLNGNRFKVRLMRGYSDDLNELPTGSPSFDEYMGSLNEWDDLVYPLSQYVPTKQRMANVQAATRAQLYLSATTSASQMVIQERSSTVINTTYNDKPPLLRGQNLESRLCVAALRTGVNNSSYATAVGYNVYGWWPVLELLDN